MFCPSHGPVIGAKLTRHVFTRVLCKQFSQLSTSGNDFIEAVRIEIANDLDALQFLGPSTPCQSSPFLIARQESYDVARNRDIFNTANLVTSGGALDQVERNLRAA